ncbi:PAS domain S-box protein [Armatimonas sp.]|uniref:PAS domain S-box protein n=1 Tax=Armatimonas sp. TaxID=1872638 RepID=UPI00374CF698
MEDILDLIPCGFLRLAEGSDGAILRTNATLLAMLGYGAGELEGRGVDAVLSSEARSFWQTDFLPLIALRGEAEEIYLSLLDKQGETVPVLVNAVRRTTDGEAFIDCIFVRRKPRDHDSAMEITGRKQAEERLREHAEILSQVSDAVGMIDNDERILYLNSAGEHLYRVKAADVLGRKLSALYQRRWLKPEDEAAANAMLRERGEAVWELIHVTQDGRELHVQSSVSLMRDAAGTITGIIAAIRDITERKRADGALRDSEARFHGILRQSPAGIVQTDATGCMTLVNERWCEMLGYSEAELLGKSVLDITHSSSLTVTAENVARLAAGGPDFQIEKNYCRKDGSVFPAQTNVRALRSAEGQFLGLVAAVVDLSERLRAEEALRTMNEQLVLGSVRLHDLAATEVSLNEQLRERAGQLDLLVRSARRLLECHSLTPEVRQEIFGGIAELIGVGSFFHYRADNSERSLYLEASGGLSEEQCRAYGSLKFGELLCGRVAESGQRLIVEDLPRSTQPGSESLRAAGAQSYAGFPLLDSRGELVGTLAFISPERTHFREGDVQMIETICAQVALMMERKRAAEALRKSEEFSRTVLQSSPDCVKVVDRDGVLISLNEPGRCLLELDDPAAALGKKWWELWPEEARPQVCGAFERARAGEVARFEQFCPTARGTPKWWDVQVSPVHDGDGAVERVVAVSRDVTERRENDEASRKQKRFLDRITAVTPDVLYVLDITDYHFKWVSQQAANRMGYSAEEILAMGADFMPRVMHPDDLARMPAHFAELARAADGQTLEIDYRLRHPDGSWRWFGGRKTPFIRDADGRVREIIGTSVDITARNLAEKGLRASDERFRIAENASLSFVYEWDVTTGRETRSEGFTKVLGYEADEFPYGGEAWEALIHPDDVPHVRKATVEKPSSDGPSRVEYRLRRKDGEWRSVFDEFMRFWDRDGNLTRVVGSIVDITERKLAEEKIRVSEERLNLLHEITSNSTLGNAARLQSLLRLGCEQFDLENGLVGEVTGDIYKVALGISPGNSIPVGFACPVKDALCDEVLKRNDLLAIENVGGGEWRGHRAHSVFGTEVYFGVPINVDGRVFGTLCFTSPKPRDTAFTRGDHEFLRLLAQTIGTEMTRQQIADKLRQSEAFNRTVLESSPDCVKVLDGEGRLQFMNANGCALMEIDDFAAVRDQPWIALWPSAGESLMHDAVEKAANGETVRFQVFATTAKGTPKWWDVILAPVSSDGERAKSLISVSRDITESKAKQTALERSENRLHRLFETNVVGMIHWNLESSLILDANREFFQMTGYTREDVASGLIDFRKLTPPEWTARNEEGIRAIREQGFAAPYEKEYFRKDGSRVALLIAGTRFEDSSSEGVSFLIDISKRKQQQQLIENLNVRLQRSVAESHHRIKNNLQVLSAIIELQSSAEDGMAKEKWGRLSNHISSLASLHDILTLKTRVEDEDVDRVNVKLALEKMFPLLSTAMGNRRMSLDADETIFLPLKEVSSFSLLFNELVSNARKHGVGDIEVSLKREATNIKLEVCDDGPGFPVGFDPLRSANTGLELIESLGGWDLGGSVAYENRPEGGARVTVRFPSVT